MRFNELFEKLLLKWKFDTFCKNQEEKLYLSCDWNSEHFMWLMKLVKLISKDFAVRSYCSWFWPEERWSFLHWQVSIAIPGNHESYSWETKRKQKNRLDLSKTFTIKLGIIFRAQKKNSKSMKLIKLKLDKAC